MILSVFKENSTLFIIIGVVIVLLIISLIVLFTRKKGVPKRQAITVDTTILEEIFNALGVSNIVSVNREQDRIKLIVHDVKKIDAKVLTKHQVPAFLKGNEVKLLFKDNSLQLYEYLNDKIKKQDE